MSQEETPNPVDSVSGQAQEAARGLRTILRLVRWCLAGIVCLILFAVIGMHFLKSRWETLGDLTPYFDFEGPDTKFSRLERNRAGQQPTEREARPEKSRSSWPEYRGSQRDGYSKETNLLEKWPNGGPPELYRQPVGLGFAGFVISGGKAYTIEQRRE
ncbi:MAG: hypothetical protein QGF00_01110, partial [Planctomycetota bacterium]|nr:hypothetical protein [Planctomycetota bacterium]